MPTGEGFDVINDLLGCEATLLPSGDKSMIGAPQYLNSNEEKGQKAGERLNRVAFRNGTAALVVSKRRDDTGNVINDFDGNPTYEAKFDFRPRDTNEFHAIEIPGGWESHPVPPRNFDRFLFDFALAAIIGSWEKEDEDGVPWAEHDDIRQQANALKQIIYVMIGSCIFDNRLQRFYVMLGEGGSGKGVIFRMVRRLVGGHIKPVEIPHLDSRFECGEMRHKKALFFNEMPPRQGRGRRTSLKRTPSVC